LEQRLLRLENRNGQPGGKLCLGPAVVPSQPVDKETAAMRARVALQEAEVKHLRSEMQAKAIYMGRFTFVSRVGTVDW
jgi:hypothetical protein